MTEREKIERELILDILAESSKWRITEDDQDVDCIRMEVMDRARRLLLGMETIDENGRAQSHPDKIQTESEDVTESERIANPENVKKSLNSWKSQRVRVNIDGKSTWKLECECHKEIIPGFEKKWHWVWNGTDVDDKQEQCDAMWAEHEQDGGC